MKGIVSPSSMSLSVAATCSCLIPSSWASVSAISISSSLCLSPPKEANKKGSDGGGAVKALRIMRLLVGSGRLLFGFLLQDFLLISGFLVSMNFGEGDLRVEPLLAMQRKETHRDQRQGKEDAGDEKPSDEEAVFGRHALVSPIVVGLPRRVFRPG